MEESRMATKEELKTIRQTIPRTLKETATVKPAPEFKKLWKKYMAENKELNNKENRSYMLFIKALAKHNFMQHGEQNIYVAHNEAIDFFTAED